MHRHAWWGYMCALLSMSGWARVPMSSLVEGMRTISSLTNCHMLCTKDYSLQH